METRNNKSGRINSWTLYNLGLIAFGAAGLIYTAITLRNFDMNRERVNYSNEMQAIEEQSLERKLTPSETSLLNNVDNEVKSLARQVAIRDYQPIGNGGALSAASGKISQERRFMLKAVEERYLGLLGSSVYELKRLQK